jgi:hypothetical protein
MLAGLFLFREKDQNPVKPYVSEHAHRDPGSRMPRMPANAHECRMKTGANARECRAPMPANAHECPMITGANAELRFDLIPIRFDSDSSRNDSVRFVSDSIRFILKAGRRLKVRRSKGAVEGPKVEGPKVVGSKGPGLW